MKPSFTTRLAAVCAALTITLVIIESVALLGHPRTESGAEMARAVAPVVAEADR